MPANQEPVCVAINELAKLAFVAHETMQKRLDERGIRPNVFFRSGQRKPWPLYDPTRPEVQQVLSIDTTPETQ